MSDEKPTYKVGYKKPPRKSQFKKGTSGNPKGRSRGSRNTIKLFEEISDEKITVRENGSQKRVSKREAMLMRLWQKGIEGNPKAIDKILSMNQEVERRRHRDEVIADYIYKTICQGLNKARSDPETLEWLESIHEMNVSGSDSDS